MNSYPLEYFKAVQDVLCSEEDAGNDPFAKEILDALASVGALASPPASVQRKPTLYDLSCALETWMDKHGYADRISGLQCMSIATHLLAAPIWPTQEPPATVDADAEETALWLEEIALGKLWHAVNSTGVLQQLHLNEVKHTYTQIAKLRQPSPAKAATVTEEDEDEWEGVWP